VGGLIASLSHNFSFLFCILYRAAGPIAMLNGSKCAVSMIKNNV